MKMSVGEEVSLNKTYFDNFSYNPVGMFTVFLNTFIAKLPNTSS